MHLDCPAYIAWWIDWAHGVADHLPVMRWLGALVGFAAAVALVVLMGASGALADGGPHVLTTNNGSAGINADSCAGCHRAHTASGPLLLKAEDDAALCLACHGSGAPGSTTDVENGTSPAIGRGLKGGGFSKALMDTNWSGGAVSRDITSAHTYDILADVTAWGNGAINSGAGPTFELTCVTCHNPHGNGAYRILRPIPTNSGATAVAVSDEAVKVYTVSSAENRYFGQVYGGGNQTKQYELDRWCATCHTRYDTSSAGSGHTDSGDGIYQYRHLTRYASFLSVNCELCHSDPDDFTNVANPLDVTTSTTHFPVCQNCHVAHGSAATMGTTSGAVPWPDGATSPSGNARSSLLRLDNRGVCLGCHDPTR